MAAPAHYLASEARCEAIEETRTMIADVRKELIARIERLEAVIQKMAEKK